VTDSTVDHINADLRRITKLRPRAEAIIRWTLADGFPSDVGYDKTTTRNGQDNSSVENAVIRRIPGNHRIETIRDELNAAKNIVGNLATELDKICAFGRRAAVPRCTPVGREGADQWGDKHCAEVPSRGPLCDRCAKREYRWRIANGLDARIDGPFGVAVAR
jgi:hypothetical protein